MKRLLIIAVLIGFAYPLLLVPQSNTTHTSRTRSAPKKKKVPCRATLADCPDEGCGSKFDPNLNKLKNITSLDGDSSLKTLTWMKKLDDPDNFTEGGNRDELADLGEGEKITIVAYLLVAKAEGAESCNCGLTSKQDTDNHLVLASKATVEKYPIASTAEANKKIFHQRELESETAEFTPRVRLEHPAFTRQTMQPLINKTDEKALLVRVTGQLLFDSEHFIRNHLVRVNNWEIHPILKLEYCETGDDCKSKGGSGWKSIDDMPQNDANAAPAPDRPKRSGL